MRSKVNVGRLTETLLNDALRCHLGLVNICDAECRRVSSHYRNPLCEDSEKAIIEHDPRYYSRLWRGTRNARGGHVLVRRSIIRVIDRSIALVHPVPPTTKWARMFEISSTVLPQTRHVCIYRSSFCHKRPRYILVRDIISSENCLLPKVLGLNKKVIFLNKTFSHLD